MISIYYGLLLSCYILKSISYGKEKSSSKEAIRRVSNCIKNGSIGIITIYFVLQLTNSLKWIIFSCIILLMIFEVILDSINKLLEFKYLFYGLTLLIMILSIKSIYPENIIFMIGITSILIDGISNILGPTIKNNKVLSFDIISFIIFGIFLVLI